MVPAGRTTSPAELLAEADAALYEAKGLGRNCHVVRVIGDAAVIQPNAAWADGMAEDIAQQIASFMSNGFATGSIVYVDGGALVN